MQFRRLQLKFTHRSTAWDSGVLGYEGKAYRMGPPGNYSSVGSKNFRGKSYLEEEKDRI